MRFELYRLVQPEGATFRHWDRDKHELALVIVPVARWERMGRPLSIEVGIEGPGQGWFTELNGHDDPTIWDGDEPVISRSAIPGHWDELVAKLGLAP